jgi:SP family arabinose:H+ symporter-like MFS transporter
MVNVVSTFIAIGLVDKVGRKKFLLAGSLIMGISLATVACCFQYRYFDNYIVLLFMLLYVSAFGCTLGAVTWVYLSEIFPNRVRGLALSVVTLALWLADFAVTYTFPIMTKKLGTAPTMYCYAALCALSFLYVWVKVRETKGKSLEEIEHVFIPKSK